MAANGNNLLSVEWDRDELRYLWAGKGPRRLVVRAMGRIRAEDAAEQGEAEPSFEWMLGELKRRLRTKNSRATVVLPRGEVETFDATFPPASDQELGSLVVNEAHKHLANADDARIDYLEIERSGDETRRMAIVALPQAGYTRISAAIKQLGWKLESVQLRHVAAAGLLRKLIDLSSQPRSIAVCINANDIELLILERERVILVRSISLSGESDAAALAERLAVEIQRSLMVTARAEANEGTVADQIYVLGDQAEQQALLEPLAQALQLPTRIVNPLDAFVAKPKKVPEQLHQFAGLIGALVDQPAQQTIDLQNSKCGTAPTDWWKRALVYGSAAAVVLGGVVWWALNSVGEARSLNAVRQRELDKLEKQYEQLLDRVAVVEQVSAWRSDDINWLDELRELSVRFPERSMAQVKSMTLSSNAASPGVISMNLQAKNESVITQMEHTIRDQYHQVKTNQFSQSDADEEFPWHFGATILIEPRGREDFVAALGPGEPPPDDGAEPATAAPAEPVAEPNSERDDVPSPPPAASDGETATEPVAPAAVPASGPSAEEGP